MAELQPLFVDVTWVAGGRTGELTRTITAHAKKVRFPQLFGGARALLTRSIVPLRSSPASKR